MKRKTRTFRNALEQMEGLQELLQRTETIQKINALQEQAARTLFTWPVLT